MKRIIFSSAALLVLLGLVSCTHGESFHKDFATDATVCAVTDDPESYLGKHIRVSGFVKPSYHNIFDKKCLNNPLLVGRIPANQIGRVELAEHLLRIDGPGAPLYTPESVVVADFIGIMLPAKDDEFGYGVSRFRIEKNENIRIENVPEAALLEYRSSR